MTSWPCPDPEMFSVQQSSTSYRFPANWGPRVQTHEPLGDIFHSSQNIHHHKYCLSLEAEGSNAFSKIVSCSGTSPAEGKLLPGCRSGWHIPHTFHGRRASSLDRWRCWNVPRVSKRSQTLACVGKNQQSALSRQRQVKAWN